MVGASKKFFDPDNYKFILGPIYTFDGGQTWHESTLPMHADWNGMSDPTVAFDSFSHAFLVGEPINPPTPSTGSAWPCTARPTAESPGSSRSS